MPILAFLFNGGGGTLSIPAPSYAFQLTTALPTGATLTRGSSATYVNNTGFLVSVGNNVARFDFGYNGSNWQTPLGLLIEPQSTNLLLNSQGYATSSWVSHSNTVSAAATVAPDNTTTGAIVTANAASAGATTTDTPSESQTSSVTAGTVYTFSGYFSQIGTSDPYVVIEMNDTTHGRETVSFNLATHVFATDTSSGITEESRSFAVMANSWNRVTSTITPSFSSTAINYAFWQNSLATAAVNPNLAPSADLTTWTTISTDTTVATDAATYQGYPQYDVGYSTSRSGLVVSVPNFTAGSTYTVTVRATGTVPFTFNFWNGASPNDGSDQTSPQFTPTATNNLFTWTFTPTTGPNLTIALTNQTSLAAGTNVYTEFKIETGSKFTGYVPPGAPTGGNTNPNLVFSCSTFDNVTYWTSFGGSTITGTVVDPNGASDAQQASFVATRSGYYQPLKLTANTTYVGSIYAKSYTAGASFYLGYWNGLTAIQQYSATLTPDTAAWTRYNFTFTTGTGDTNFFISITNSKTDGDVAAPVGTIALWGCDVTLGATLGDFAGCATIPPPTAANFAITTQTAIATTINIPSQNGGETLSSVAIIASPSHGTASVNATNIVYTSSGGYTGGDSMTYTATNSSGTSPVATITLTVQATPPAGGRNWILGWYTYSIPAPSPNSFLGFPPEVDYGAAFEDSPGFGGFAILYQGDEGVFGYPTVLAAALGPSGLENANVDYAGAAAGNYDANFNSVIDGVIATGQSGSIYMVRIDPEFNANIGNINPTTYINAWNRCAAIWKSRLPAVKTCWNPQIWPGDSVRGAVGPYFPGTAHCDVVGIDCYTQTSTIQYHVPASDAIGNATFVGSLEYYKTLNFGNLPWCFPEWGDQYQNADNDGSQLDAIITWIDAQSNFIYAGWWNGVGSGRPLTQTGRDVMIKHLKGRPYTGTYWLPLKPIPQGAGLNP